MIYLVKFEEIPIPTGEYKYYETEKLYEVIGGVCNVVTGGVDIVYRSKPPAENKVYVTPLERFTKLVSNGKYGVVPRFQKVN